jgi:hypothetical protein
MKNKTHQKENTVQIKKKTLSLGQEFSTRDDAFAYVSNGRKMSNRMMLSESNDTHNVVFFQRGLATYVNKEHIHHVYVDRIESIRAREKPFCFDLNKPCLIFLKEFKRGNKALSYYKFHGEFRIKTVQSILSTNDYTIFAKTANDVKVKA